MKSNRGFTLIELMIVVVIIAILAGIAYPSYDEYVKRGNRTEGQALLSEAAATQERYFSQNNTYITTQADIGKLHMRNTSGTTVKSSTGKYSLTVDTVANDGGYRLIANQAFNDLDCGNLRGSEKKVAHRAR
ncbi:TPA: type IV pilin protein [Pseudomonas aeruginosa]|nr:type IV pilin protein [Pseudomonas aeruginosa]